MPRSVSWEAGVVRLLDQTRLPGEEVYLSCTSAVEVRDAIRRLAVRGAPAIGIAAAYGLIAGADTRSDREAFASELTERAAVLVAARPTAVNLAWAVDRMLAKARTSCAADAAGLYAELEREAIAIHDEDRAACRAIGDAGKQLVASHPRLLTHCNAGALAVSELGTALAPVYVAHAAGARLHVYVDETRPLLQGARLTTYELQRAGVPNTLITDSMAATVMAQGRVDAVIVGADRVAANGDVANKIGTLNLAILARHFGLPFFVACPVSTIDRGTPTGASIEIEERNADELTHAGGVPVAPPDTVVFNPAFDVTPASLVTAIITERGVSSPPFSFPAASRHR